MARATDRYGETFGMLPPVRAGRSGVSMVHLPSPIGYFMSGLLHPFLVSAGVVATAEFGDKTQLLALVLSSRFRKPLPIIIGILLATVANHAAAAWLGEWLGSLFTGDVLRWVLGISFLAGAVWVLIPDKLEQSDSTGSVAAYGAFVATVASFFVAEIGDKTQIATVALAARFETLIPVVAGTTLGMLIANVPAVLLGNAASHRIPVVPIRIAAAVLFTVLGLRELL